MMLDPKRTFDELIERLAPDDKTRDEILANRIYRELSGAVAGSQEFTAVAKLYELDRSGRFDVIVLDTPPSRNALDFLDAPDRLTGFLEGRALRLFLAPTRPGGAASSAAGRASSSACCARVTGVDLMDDLSVFFARARAACSTASASGPRASRRCWRPGDDVPDRHLARARAGRGGDLLPRQAARGGDAVRRADRQPRAPAGRATATRTSTRRRSPPSCGGDAALARKVARTLRRVPRARAPRRARRWSGCARELGDDDPIVVPHLDGDVHDVDGLVAGPPPPVRSTALSGARCWSEAAF